MKKIDKRGVTAVEGVLIIVILAIIGFVAYYVAHSLKQTNSNYQSASQSSTAPKFAKTSSLPSVNRTLVIKQWDVKAIYKSSLDLQYVPIAQQDNTAIGLSSNLLVAANSGCSAKSDGAGIIDRFTANQTVEQGDEPLPTDPTAQALASTLSPADYAHVGNYYYFYKHPQGLCGGTSSNTSNLENLQVQTINVVKQALSNFQAE